MKTDDYFVNRFSEIFVVFYILSKYNLIENFQTIYPTKHIIKFICIVIYILIIIK